MPQIEAARTRTSTSFAPISGIGTVSTCAPGAGRGNQPDFATLKIAGQLGIQSIPAVIAYNKFSNELDKFSGKLEDFSVEFNTLLSRQIEG